MVVVCAVVVTYADRFLLVGEETVRRARISGAGQVVVVNNGAHEPSAARLHAYADLHPDVTVVDLPTNLGSAGGFAAGIEAAQQRAPLIWLLDDDNWVDPETLSTLVAERDQLCAMQRNDRVAIAAARPLNGFHRRVVDGLPPDIAFPPRGAFLGIDIGWLLRRAIECRLKGWHRRPTSAVHGIPYLPYGGLLFPAVALREVGYPAPEFYLYADDTEWTSRLRQAGYTLALSPNAVARDAESKWIGPAGRSIIANLLEAGESERLYYSVRNRTAFDRNSARNRWEPIRYTANKAAIQCLALAHSIRHRSGYQMFRLAIREGEAMALTGRIVGSR